uniref:Enoyl-CoA delta isomerase 2, mitochondrial n=1 Tax=Timema shepardi TaxID=629360 RepID=A0A7R9ATI9_TIMSH|nr:unnamed protein product [Timema shepardi]
MASLVLTDSSQLTADGFDKLPDQIMYPYAESYDLQKICMYEEISIALERAVHNDQIVIVALTGVGEYYSSGNDITSSFAGNMEDVVAAASKKFENLVETFINFPKILVAVVNGPAIGIAVTTLGLCDVVFASDKATFQTPFSKLGLVAEGCSSYMFPMIMGHQRSMSMLCLNTKMNAMEAKECGLVTEVFPHRTFQEEVWARLVQYADLPAKSLFSTKRLIRLHERDALKRACRAEALQLKEMYFSEDFIKAMLNFSSKKSKL